MIQFALFFVACLVAAVCSQGWPRVMVACCMCGSFLLGAWHG